MTPFIWTKVPPITAGFYWFRDSTGLHFADVFQDHERFMVLLLHLTRCRVVEYLLSTPIPLAILTGEWAGPLEPPR